MPQHTVTMYVLFSNNNLYLGLSWHFFLLEYFTVQIMLWCNFMIDISLLVKFIIILLRYLLFLIQYVSI